MAVVLAASWFVWFWLLIFLLLFFFFFAVEMVDGTAMPSMCVLHLQRWDAIWRHGHRREERGDTVLPNASSALAGLSQLCHTLSHVQPQEQDACRRLLHGL